MSITSFHFSINENLERKSSFIFLIIHFTRKNVRIQLAMMIKMKKYDNFVRENVKHERNLMK